MKLKLKISTLIFLMCFFFQNSYSQQNVNGWYWMNGQPQSNTLNWVKFINSTTVIAGGSTGCFMKSTDGGDSWIINSQAGPASATTSGGETRTLFAAHFFDANTGLVGGSSLAANGDAIARTTDGGLTFTRISLGAAAHSVTGFYFVNSTTGYACGNTTTRIYKTTDAGVSWNAVPNVPSFTYNAIYAFNENKILAVSSNRILVRTTDGGANWDTETIPGSTNNSLTDIEFKDANTGYVTGNANYFGYSTDGGLTWTQAITPLGASGQRALSISGSDVYTAGDNTLIYKTTDDGTSWTSINIIDGSNPNQPTAGIMYGMDVSGNDFAVVGSSGIVNISNDAGSTWRNKNYCVSQTAFNFSAIWADTPTGYIWSGGTAGSILYSSNGGANWSQSSTGSTFPTNKMQFLNSTTGFAAIGSSGPGGGPAGVLVKTTDAGLSWNNIPLPAPYSGRNAADVEFINENTGWVLGGNPFASGGGITCLKTTDGGSSWTQQNNDVSYNQISVDIDMVDANTGYFIAGTAVSVFKTTNGGDNWNRLVSSPGTSTYNRIEAVSSDVIFVSGSSGALFKSTDGGTTWNTIAVPRPVTLFAMDWLDEENGLLGGTSGFLAKTTDGGTTWDWTNSGGSTIRDVCLRNRDSIFAVSDINGNWQMFRNFAQIAGPLSLVVKVGIEGFWNGTTQVSDTISVTLRSSNSPYNIVDQNGTVIYSQGGGTVTFSTATAGNYYIQINHRNSLETWSSSPVSLGSNLNSYNFTTAASQAYGNNTVLKSGRFCNFSGDVTQEGSIDLADQIQIFNSSSVFSSGYVVDDVNGDGLVDLTDIVIASNNAAIFVTKQTP